MADQEDSLVMRRSKRSTAGNRMEAALAEFRAEDVGVDTEEDIDFIVEKDEEDAFESDFESTDEEVAQEDVDATAEKLVREEERATHKTARSKLDKVTAAAHARQKATFNPQIHETLHSQTNTAEKAKRRVSLGVAVNAETGEIMETAKRQSRRSHTMLNTSATASRMKDEAEKKSALPKKVKAQIRAPTQDELIARALDMEEGNIVEHRNYLSLEEEKRKKARLVRTTVQGPLLRWVSKAEEIKVKVEAAPLPQCPYGHTYYSTSTSGSMSSLPAHSSISYLHPSASSYSPDQTTIASVSSQHHAAFVNYASPSIPPLPTPEIVERTEKVTKNYVVHELTQSDKASRPPWNSTMKAMFGDHVVWEDLRVYTTKGRPFVRPTQTCPISGKVARYRDPRTGVPFSDIQSYEILSKILAHEYVWSDDLGCYIGHEASISPDETVPSSGKHQQAKG
ncbi:hypothetical protein AcV5_003985 [Taiwanofungus camphoratus]|nr:hypothetical protein AcV5_003985 [Antrodia cinnamomea]